MEGRIRKRPISTPELLLELREQGVEALHHLRRFGLGQAHAVGERGEDVAEVVHRPGGVEGVDADEDLLVALAVALEEAPHEAAGGVLLGVRDRVLEVDDDRVAAEHGDVLQHRGHVARARTAASAGAAPGSMIVLMRDSMKTVGMPPVRDRWRSSPSARSSVSTISQVAKTRASRRCPAEHLARGPPDEHVQVAVELSPLVGEDVPGEAEELERALDLVQVHARRADGQLRAGLDPAERHVADRADRGDHHGVPDGGRAGELDERAAAGSRRARS